jgi:hypothetical protein
MFKIAMAKKNMSKFSSMGVEQRRLLRADPKVCCAVPDCVILDDRAHGDGHWRCGRMRASDLSAGGRRDDYPSDLRDAKWARERPADPGGAGRVGDAKDRHAGGDERYSVFPAHRLPLALSARTTVRRRQAGERPQDRKIHALVDSEGPPMPVVVHSAAIQDRGGAGLISTNYAVAFP